MLVCTSGWLAHSEVNIQCRGEGIKGFRPLNKPSQDANVKIPGCNVTRLYNHSDLSIECKGDGWMNGVLGHFYALSMLDWAVQRRVWSGHCMYQAHEPGFLRCLC